MKKHLFALAVAALPLAAMAQTESYTLDTYHTYPNFMVEHWGLSMMHGQFGKATGKFAFDKAAKSGSVDLSIETASLSTGDNDKGARPRSRDEHLRSADFFNVAEFPKVTFKSTKVAFTGALTIGLAAALFASASLMLAQLPWYALPLMGLVPFALLLSPGGRGPVWRRAVILGVLALLGAAAPLLAAWSATAGQ